MGLGIVASGSRLVTDEMFLAAARTLADLVTKTDLDQGRIYPSLTQIRHVSLAIAVVVADIAEKRGLATEKLPADLENAIRTLMYQPDYTSYV